MRLKRLVGQHFTFLNINTCVKCLHLLSFLARFSPFSFRVWFCLILESVSKLKIENQVIILTMSSNGSTSTLHENCYRNGFSWPLPKSLFQHYPDYRQGPKPWTIICRHCNKQFNIIHHKRRQNSIELMKRHRQQHQLIQQHQQQQKTIPKPNLKIRISLNKQNNHCQSLLIHDYHNNNQIFVANKSCSMDLQRLPLKKRFSSNFQRKYDNQFHDIQSSSPSSTTTTAARSINRKLSPFINTASNKKIEIITID